MGTVSQRDESSATGNTQGMLLGKGGTQEEIVEGGLKIDLASSF